VLRLREEEPAFGHQAWGLTQRRERLAFARQPRRQRGGVGHRQRQPPPSAPALLHVQPLGQHQATGHQALP